MKHLILFLSLFIASAGLQAQCVVNTSYSGPGFYTNNGDSVLDDAILDSLYSENVSLYVPSTYDIGGFNVNVDSVKIENILGLPDGIGSACTPTSCFWLGGDTGCVLISGTPTNAAQIGNNPLTIKMRFYGLSTSVGEDVTVFSIDLSEGQTTQPNSVNKAQFANYRIAYSRDLSSLRLISGNKAPFEANIIDITGQTKLSGIANSGESELKFDTSSLAPGIYIVQYSQANSSRSSRIVIGN